MSKQHYTYSLRLNKAQRTSFDRLVGVASVVYPLTGLPQLWLVMQGKVDGVSALSWAGFALFSVLFFVYGLVHRVKPMIVTNLAWFVIEVMVVCLTLMHRMMR